MRGGKGNADRAHEDAGEAQGYSGDSAPQRGDSSECSSNVRRKPCTWQGAHGVHCVSRQIG